MNLSMQISVDSKRLESDNCSLHSTYKFDIIKRSVNIAMWSTTRDNIALSCALTEFALNSHSPYFLC